MDQIKKSASELKKIFEVKKSIGENIDYYFSKD